uniref:C2H2-type domain-containing protein n=1 Tax=Timema cristinae TaxID=61476 RepID=A0A7R9D445_TIMCR|nr:unnamed protein product [Timema cristinae]
MAAEYHLENQQHKDAKVCYSAPSTPPEPIIAIHMPERKVICRRRGRPSKHSDDFVWMGINRVHPDLFGSKDDLRLHTQIHMREVKPYKCTMCSKAFAHSSYLSQHNRIHLGIKPYTCEFCQRKFTQLSHLQQHTRTHTGEKPYKCRYPECNKAFSQLSNLQSHARCHLIDKPYRCTACFKCFSDEPSMVEHVAKHKEKIN